METSKKKFNYKVFLKRLILPFALFVGIVLLDYGVKQLVIAFMAENQSITVIPNFFSITFIKNPGAAFGIFSGHTTLFLVITGIAIPLILAAIAWFYRSHKMLLSALALVAAGGLGNFIDRAASGEVTDMFHFFYFGAEIFGQSSFPVFNVADIALTVGMVMLIVYFLFVYYDKKDPEAVAKHDRKAREKAERKATKRANKDAASVVSVEEFLLQENVVEQTQDGTEQKL